MVQNATASEFYTFPSTADDQYRSIKTTVETESEALSEQAAFVAFFSEFKVADGQTISGISLGASGFLDGPDIRREVGACMQDLQAAKDAFDLWYQTSLGALKEVAEAL